MSYTFVSRRDVRETTSFHGMITVADQMLRLFRLIERVARSETTVLIQGETGTGKGLVARALHLLGPRRAERYCAINCATLTPELLTSELFGHARGAFNGAVQSRQGLFAQADGGTIFVDQVAEIGPEAQGRLLRILNDRTFIPLGSIDPISADVRIISATSTALRELVDNGRFRADLMYRIGVVPLFVPPLRQRTGDIQTLAWHMVDLFNRGRLRHVEGFEQEAMAALLAYRWPGNVRELRNAIEHAFTVGDGPLITVDDFPPELRGEPTGLASCHDPRDSAGVERVRILKALHRTHGRKAAAARLLEMSRSTLWRKMRELDI